MGKSFEESVGSDNTTFLCEREMNSQLFEFGILEKVHIKYLLLIKATHYAECVKNCMTCHILTSIVSFVSSHCLLL